MSIAVRAVRGAAWTISTGIGSRALGLVGTLVMTHFLSPADLGEVSVATVLVLTASQLSTLGMGQYLIAQKESDESTAWHVTFFHLVLGVLVLGAVVLLRDPLGPVFDAPLMGRFIPGMALAAMLDRVGMVPEKLLIRDMRFRTIGIARTVGELTYTLGSLAFAAYGWGGMAIVVANVLRALVWNGMLLQACTLRSWISPGRIDGKTTRTLLAYGLPLSAGTLAEFAARRWDNLIMSRFFGPAVMGNYNLAYNLADVPAAHVGEHIGEVLMPSFARMEPAEAKESLLSSTALLSLIIFPLAVGLGAVAPSLVRAFFDERWTQVAPMLTMLSVLSISRPIGWTITAYQQARMQPMAAMGLGFFKVIVLLGSLALIGRHGPLWACAGIGIGFATYALASLITVRITDGVPVLRFIGGFLPPFLACCPMALAVFGTRYLLSSFPAGLSLFAEIVVGAVVYVGSAFLFARPLANELIALVRSAIVKKG